MKQQLGPTETLQPELTNNILASDIQKEYRQGDILIKRSRYIKSKNL